MKLIKTSILKSALYPFVADIKTVNSKLPLKTLPHLNGGMIIPRSLFKFRSIMIQNVAMKFPFG